MTAPSAQSTNLIGSYDRGRTRSRSRRCLCEINEMTVQNPARWMLEEELSGMYYGPGVATLTPRAWQVGIFADADNTSCR
eukprot:15048406-Heterocapsa_arctica.AAC.1